MEIANKILTRVRCSFAEINILVIAREEMTECKKRQKNNSSIVQNLKHGRKYFKINIYKENNENI